MSYQSVLDNARVQWANVRGDLSDGSYGDNKPVPAIMVGDMVVLLSYVTVLMKEYITSHNSYGDNIFGEGDNAVFHDLSPITVDDYLGRASPTPLREPAYRSVTYTSQVGTGSYGPYVPQFKYQDLGEALIKLWQSCVDMTAYWLSHHSPLDKLDLGTSYTIWNTVDNICVSLDDANELPANNWQLLGQAVTAEKNWAISTTKETIKTGAGLAGEALASAADTAGEAGGKFLASFLSSAGIPALLVTAGAIFIAMRML